MNAEILHFLVIFKMGKSEFQKKVSELPNSEFILITEIINIFIYIYDFLEPIYNV